MAVSEKTPLKTYTATGASAVFAFDFQVLDSADMAVLVDGAPPTSFVVAGVGNPAGGTVTISPTPTVGQVVVLYRDSELSRKTDYQSDGDLLAAVLNRDFDRLWLVIQEIVTGGKPTSQGVLRVPEIGEDINTEFPPAESRALKLAAFDSAGGVTTVPTVEGSGLELATLLADGADEAHGAGLVAWNSGLTYAPGTVGAALADAAGGGVVVVDTVADLRDETGTQPVAMTRGYWTAGDGGSAIYMLEPQADASPGDNAGTVIERDDGRWYSLYKPGETIPARQLGVYIPAERIEEPDALNPGYVTRWNGAVTGSGDHEPAFLPNGYSTTAWLMQADSQVRALGKALGIEGVVHCDAQVVVDAPTTWRFSGRNGVGTSNAYLNLPQSYLYQANVSMVGSVLCIVSHPGVRFFGGGILGPIYEATDADGTWYFPEGLARDGLFIGSNSFCWFDSPVIANMGRDAVRAGDYSGGAGTNANGFYLQKPIAVRNGRHGFHISDDSGSIDANAFLIESPVAQQNFGTAFLFGKTALGGTIISPKVENNGRGWFFDATTSDIVVVGGNTEANVGWRYPDVAAATLNNVEMAPEAVGRNFFVHHTVQGVVRNDIVDGSVIERNKPSRTALDLINSDASTFADTMLRLTTTAGLAGVWKRSAAVGGELFVGNDGSYPLGIILNGIIRWGFLPSGALTIGGLSNAGTTGQVLTSQGASAAPIWASAGGASPLTTKGDVYTRNASADARLPVGTNGQVLTADSAEATGLKWSTVTGTGTVTSVGMTVPTGLTVGGSPVTASGTFALTWDTGYEGYTSAEKAKLAALPSAAVNKAGDTMTGDLLVSKADATLQATASTGNANLVAATAGGITGGLRSGGGAVEVGALSAHDTRLLSNATARITLFAAGNVQVNVSGATLYLTGLPTSSPGVPGAVWRDGSGYLRIA